MSQELRERYRAEDPNGACNHETRPHRRDDLARYLFVSAYDVRHRESAKPNNFAAELLPMHKNAVSAREPHELFDDSFRGQLVAWERGGRSWTLGLQERHRWLRPRRERWYAFYLERSREPAHRKSPMVA